ncbi:uncharacterized protein LOC112503189 [Cynara cardunculus var. scolymus]|uniref:NUDIX hydrolase domain-like protein n=1 Tax=Cynara cardunculus var. scolymus TaxID=59895 RepID=A0A103XCY9_CYNCS|nr:uncharacterized protein LOC112502169 [Cynara cardunculus var. scolymus]XP_024963027.1 uncharacterized protein LOC112503189 [Cynara cardunculus var. scolymus]KVH87686.1 hypothetical protein Ccrd_025037 [Cynara cardunculus var. scolymus]KVH88409.1 NUDIX hydrolase domain-like protein [Cynara cardunculus var. scolymus]
MSLPPQPPPPSLHKTLPKSFSDFIFSLFTLYASSPKLTSTYNHHRRFSRFPVIPLTKTSIHHFATPQSLSDWLRPRLPSDSFAAWGTRPGTKNIHNLWLELYEGETSLADSTPPLRTVQVVVVRVRDDKNRILIESHQELSNGDVRNRSRPLSEKMKPGETVEEAVARAVKEELGSIITASCLHDDILKIIPDSYSSKVEEKVSVSYPGLPACYVLHTVDAMVDGLPDSGFCTIEDEKKQLLDDKEEAEGAVSCTKHYWKWVDSNTVSF